MNAAQVQSGSLASINLSPTAGTAKQPVVKAACDEQGLVGDAHRGQHSRQVSILDMREIQGFSRNCGISIQPGEMAENLTTSGLDISRVELLDRLTVGEQAELEVTAVGKVCHGKRCSVFQRTGRCAMSESGLFCRVVRGGEIRVGDIVQHYRRRLRVAVISVSTRAAQGIYEDRSGPAARDRIRSFLESHNWQVDSSYQLVPDDKQRIAAILQQALGQSTDIILLTGGTGIGPRDVTPEAVAPFLDKQIPGLMEAIRLKYARENPNVLLSRSVAGTAGKCLIFAIPGSPRAVEEYLAEISKTLEHAVLVLRGIDPHG